MSKNTLLFSHLYSVLHWQSTRESRKTSRQENEKLLARLCACLETNAPHLQSRDKFTPVFVLVLRDTLVQHR